MKINLFIVLACLCTAGSVFSEPSEKEIIGLMNRVQARVADGDIKALDELTILPPKWSTAAFLTIFKNYYNIKDGTAKMKATAIRTAELATTTSGSEDYIVKLLKGKTANNYVYFQQDAAIKCLLVVHNDTSVRILCGALDDVDRDEIGPKVTRALAMLNLPGAPVSPNQRVSNADALAKWKMWWEAHKNDYTGKAASPSPVP
jgi:hypothetical protein